MDLSTSFLQNTATVIDQSHSTRRGKSWRVVQKVMSMGCPHLENLEDSVVKEILFSDGEAHFRTLQWLVGRFHPRLQELLFSPGTSTPTVPTLTSLLADLGLCSPHDYDLVKGSTSVSKQVRFLGDLLAIIEEEGWDIDTHLDFSRLSQEDSTDSSCGFIDQLCGSEDLTLIFPLSLSLVPPGIAKAMTIGCSADGKSLDTKQRSNPPSSSELSEQLREMTQQLQSCQAELDQLTQSHTYEPLDPVAMENIGKSLLVSLETLSQLFTNFCHLYGAEIQPWTNRTMPEFTPLGLCLKRVNTHRGQVDKLIKSIDLLQINMQSLEALKTTPGSHSDVLLKVKEVISRCLTQLEGWKEPCIE